MLLQSYILQQNSFGIILIDIKRVEIYLPVFFMIMKNYITLSSLVAVCLFLSSCAAIEGIFKAGLYVGIFVVIFIVFIVGFIIFKFRK
jgi:hypothetical protein